ncbi:MAG: hypothetical protein R2745_18110 [Vicinamibacterales bacterium]
MARHTSDGMLAVLAAVAVAAVVAASPRPAAPPFLPYGDQAGYDAATDAALVEVEPVVHAPWRGLPSTPASAGAAAAVALAFWAACHVLGASRAATVVTLAALVSRPGLRALVGAAAPVALAAAGLWSAFALPALVAAARAVAVRLLALLVAAAAWPPIAVFVPLGAARGWPRPHGVAVAVATLAGVVAGAWVWADAAAAASAAPVSVTDVWHVLVTRIPRGTSPYAWPPITASRLPLALMALGLVAWSAASFRGWSALGAAAAAAGLAAAMPPAWWRELAHAAYLTAWPLAALGLTWLAGRASRGRVAITAVLGAALIGGGVSASVRHIETSEATRFAAAFAELVRATRGEASDAAFVAEDVRVDSAIVAVVGSAAGSRVRPDPAAVEARAATARRVLAGPQGRTGLELWGMRFVQAALVDSPGPWPLAARTGRFTCQRVDGTWRELSSLETTGRLGVHLPAAAGRVEVLVAGADPSAVAVTLPDGRPRGRVAPVRDVAIALPAMATARGGPGAVPVRASLDASPDRETSAVVALGGRLPAAARFVSADGVVATATVCAAPLSRDDPVGPSGDGRLALDDAAYFASGWHGAEGRGREAFRWTMARAVLLVPSSGAHGVRIEIDAQPAAARPDAPVQVTALVNGRPAAEVAMSGAGTWSWTVPASIWTDGTNEIVLNVSRTSRPSDDGSHDTRDLGLRVDDIRVSRGSGPP